MFRHCCQGLKTNNFIIYEILQSAHRPSDSRWRLVFSLPISTFRALGVSHVMRYINVRYILTYLLKNIYLLILVVLIRNKARECSTNAQTLKMKKLTDQNLYLIKIFKYHYCGINKYVSRRTNNSRSFDFFLSAFLVCNCPTTCWQLAGVAG